MCGNETCLSFLNAAPQTFFKVIDECICAVFSNAFPDFFGEALYILPVGIVSVSSSVTTRSVSPACDLPFSCNVTPGILASATAFAFFAGGNLDGLGRAMTKRNNVIGVRTHDHDSARILSA